MNIEHDLSKKITISVYENWTIRQYMHNFKNNYGPLLVSTTASSMAKFEEHHQSVSPSSSFEQSATPHKTLLSL